MQQRLDEALKQMHKVEDAAHPRGAGTAEYYRQMRARSAELARVNLRVHQTWLEKLREAIKRDPSRASQFSQSSQYRDKAMGASLERRMYKELETAARRLGDNTPAFKQAADRIRAVYDKAWERMHDNAGHFRALERQWVMRNQWGRGEGKEPPRSWSEKAWTRAWRSTFGERAPWERGGGAGARGGGNAPRGSDWSAIGATGPITSKAEARKAYRSAIASAHPDRPGGSVRKAQEINAAWDRIKAANPNWRL